MVRAAKECLKHLLQPRKKDAKKYDHRSIERRHSIFGRAAKFFPQEISIPLKRKSFCLRSDIDRGECHCQQARGSASLHGTL